MAESLGGEGPEGETPLADISGLRQSGKIRTREALNRAEFKNTNKVLSQYLFAMPAEKTAVFHTEWLRQLHREMFGDVWDWAGESRTTGLNLGVPPHQIGREMHRFVSDFHAWEEAGEDAVSISAKLHHRLVWIHPFHGGNGRWARMVANIYLKIKGAPLLEWPQDEGMIKKDFKPKYLAALKSADHGDFEDLIRLHRTYAIG